MKKWISIVIGVIIVIFIADWKFGANTLKIPNGRTGLDSAAKAQRKHYRDSLHVVDSLTKLNGIRKKDSLEYAEIAQKNSQKWKNDSLASAYKQSVVAEDNKITLIKQQKKLAKESANKNVSVPKFDALSNWVWLIGVALFLFGYLTRLKYAKADNPTPTIRNQRSIGYTTIVLGVILLLFQIGLLLVRYKQWEEHKMVVKEVVVPGDSTRIIVPVSVPDQATLRMKDTLLQALAKITDASNASERQHLATQDSLLTLIQNLSKKPVTSVAVVDSMLVWNIINERNATTSTEPPKKAGTGSAKKKKKNPYSML